MPAKLLSPVRRRAGVDDFAAVHGMSERFACRVLGQHHSTQCEVAVLVEDEAPLTAAFVVLALQEGRYGDRPIAVLLRRDGRTENVIDAFTHECPATRIARKLKALDVIDGLSDLFSVRGAPGPIRSDNGPEFIARSVRDRIAAVGSQAANIEPGNP